MARKVGTTARFKKGMMVKVKPETDSRGRPKRRWEKDENGDWHETGSVMCERIWRDRTEEEHRVWLASPDSKGMNDAGETKLDSPTRSRVPKADEVFKIVKARVKARRGWHDISGCAEIEDVEGVRWFALRTDLY